MAWIDYWKDKADLRFWSAVKRSERIDRYNAWLRCFSELKVETKGLGVCFITSSEDYDEFPTPDTGSLVYYDKESKLAVVEFVVQLEETDRTFSRVKSVERIEHALTFGYNYPIESIEDVSQIVLRETTVWDSDTLFRKRSRAEYIEQVLQLTGEIDHETRLQKVKILEERTFKQSADVGSKAQLWLEISRQLGTGVDSKLYLRDSGGFLQSVTRTLDGYNFTGEVIGEAEQVVLR